MELYCIRHGQSEANAADIHHGWGETKLSELGRSQAIKAGELLQHIKFDYVISSDLLRARQTAELALPAYTCQLDSRIREYGVGSLNGRRVEDCMREDGEPYLKAFNENDFSAYGGESPAMVSQRISEFMHELEQKEAGLYKDCRIAIVGHAGSIRHIAYYVLGCNMHKEQMLIDNCSLSRFRFKEGSWTLCLWNYSWSIE